MQTTDSTVIPNTTISIATINRINAQFWRKQRKLTVRRASDQELCWRALAKMEADMMLGLPFKLIHSSDSYLELAERSMRPDNWLARKGGRARKADALTVTIRKILRRKPRISEKELLVELEALEGQDVIEKIQSEADVLATDRPQITFRTHDGRTKTASIAGLKDRLAREKKQAKNRNSR